MTRRCHPYHPPSLLARPPGRGGLLVFLALFALWLAPGELRAEDGSPSPYHVKAAFLYNFLKFTDWPPAAGSSDTVCLGILGKDPFGDALDTVQGKSAKGRKVVVSRFRRVEDARGCEVLFISDSEKGRLTQVLKSLQGTPVLTVGDLDGFCEAGGVINLVTVRSKVSFEINAGAANRARLRLSSQLLKLARKVLE